MPTLARSTALSALAGGACWIVSCVYHASLPRGCVADECLTRAQRYSTPLDTAAGLAAAVLLALAGVGLLIMLRRSRCLGRIGATGLILAGAGAASLALGGLLTLATAPADFAYMPGFVIPGVLLVTAGMVLLAVTLVRSRFLPRWASVSLLVGAALLLFANEQTASILFAIPFGVAWVLVGMALWRRPVAVTAIVASPPSATAR